MRVAHPAELRAFLGRLRVAVVEERIEVRDYAIEGLRALEWSLVDLRLQLLDLTDSDFLRTEPSTAPEGGRIWVFTPDHWEGGFLWIRLVERHGVVVISFHRGKP